MKRSAYSMTWPRSNASLIGRNWLVVQLACGAIVNCCRSLIPLFASIWEQVGRDWYPSPAYPKPLLAASS